VLGWVKEGSNLAQISRCCHFTFHSSSPYPTPPRSTRTLCFSPQATPWLGTAKTDSQRDAASAEDAAAPSRVLCRVVAPAWRRTDPHMLQREHSSGSPGVYFPAQLSPNPTGVLRDGPETGAATAQVPAAGRFTAKVHL